MRHISLSQEKATNCSGRNIATTEEISKGVSPGEHLLHCEVMTETDDPQGSHEMRLIAVDAS